MTVGGKKKNPWIEFVKQFRKEHPDVPGGIEAIKGAKALGPKAYADFKEKEEEEEKKDEKKRRKTRRKSKKRKGKGKSKKTKKNRKSRRR